MVSHLRTHLTVLEDAFIESPDAAAFRVPKLDPATGKVDEWTSITYANFRGDVLAQASHWTRYLKSRDIQPGSVVTLWLRGLDYQDATLIFGLSRAGYTAELVSFSIPTTEAVYDVAQRAKSKILIYDSSQKDLITSAPAPIPVHCHDLKEHQELLRNSSPNEGDLPVLQELSKDPDAIAFILHTSGSTSGVPKLVPWSYRWIDGNIEKMSASALLIPMRDGFPPPKQVVQSWMGTICHGAQLLCCFGLFSNGSTILQPTCLAFNSDELIDISHRCSLTILAQFPAFFATHLQRAKKDPEMLSVLQGLGSIVLGGVALNDGDAGWCSENKIPLQLVFGSTEVGIFLQSVPGRPFTWYKPLGYGSYKLDPVEDDDSTPSSNGTEDPPSHKLVDFVVLSDSKDCPDVSLRSPKDGHFHTGDLFEEVAPGYYESRGRNDDWIKLLYAGRCDTRAMESHAISVCPDLIHDCVATGSQRLSVVLFVEPLAGSQLSEEELKVEILCRIAPGQAKMWAHEKIVHPGQIYVVPTGSLPRTLVKGNIRRKAVEAMYEKQLDGVYEAMKGV